MAEEQNVAPAAPAQGKSASGLGIAAMVIGILAILTSFLPIINNGSFFLALIGLVLAIAALVTAKKNNKGKGTSIAGLILCALSLVIVLGTQAMYGAAIDAASESLDRATGEATEEILGKDVEVTMADYELENSDGYYSGALAVTVKNLTDEKHSFTVEIEAVDKNGDRIETGYVYANDLGAGQSTTEEAFNLYASSKKEANQYKNAEFKVLEVSEF